MTIIKMGSIKKKVMFMKKKSKAAKATKSASTEKLSSFDWDFVFRTFSFRNKVVLLSLVGLTLISLSLSFSFAQPNYFYFKVGGYLGVLIMLYSLMISIKNTQTCHYMMRRLFIASDITYGAFIFLYFLFITIIN